MLINCMSNEIAMSRGGDEPLFFNPDNNLKIINTESNY